MKMGAELFGLLLAVAFLVGVIVHHWWENRRFWKAYRARQEYDARERLRQREEALKLRRGACGVLGCPNRRPHSHAADLMRRLKGR